MSDSIVCPKCSRRSFNEMDIRSKYCVSCSYHDAPIDAPPGIPGVSAKFRQPTPTMQLKAELMSIDGSFANCQGGIISLNQFAERQTLHYDRIKEILGHMDRTGRADSW